MSEEAASYIPPRKGAHGYQGAVWPLPEHKTEVATVDTVENTTRSREQPLVDLPVVSLAQGDTSLGKGDEGNFVEVGEEKRVTTRSERKEKGKKAVR